MSDWRSDELGDAGPDDRPTHWGFSRPGLAGTGAVLLIVIGVLAIILSFYDIGQLHSAADDGLTVDGTDYGIDYAQMAFSLAQIASGVFLWQGREWARIVGIICCSLNLLGGIVLLFAGNPIGALINIVVNGGIIVALTRPDVRDWTKDVAAQRNG
jgi:hypothetical protein